MLFPSSDTHDITWIFSQRPAYWERDFLVPWIFRQSWLRNWRMLYDTFTPQKEDRLGSLQNLRTVPPGEPGGFGLPTELFLHIPCSNPPHGHEHSQHPLNTWWGLFRQVSSVKFSRPGQLFVIPGHNIIHVSPRTPSVPTTCNSADFCSIRSFGASRVPLNLKRLHWEWGPGGGCRLHSDDSR